MFRHSFSQKCIYIVGRSCGRGLHSVRMLLLALDTVDSVQCSLRPSLNLSLSSRDILPRESTYPEGLPLHDRLCSGVLPPWHLVFYPFPIHIFTSITRMDSAWNANIFIHAFWPRVPLIKRVVMNMSSHKQHKRTIRVIYLIKSR